MEPRCEFVVCECFSPPGNDADSSCSPRDGAPVATVSPGQDPAAGEDVRHNHFLLFARICCGGHASSRWGRGVGGPRGKPPSNMTYVELPSALWGGESLDV